MVCGLMIGTEGPYMHMATIIAIKILKLPIFSTIYNSVEHYNSVILASCAAGAIVSTKTSIGGILFAIEMLGMPFNMKNI